MATGSPPEPAVTPHIAELVDIERRAGRDLAWIVVTCVAVCAISLWLGAIDAMIDLSSALERRNLNGLIPLMIVTPLGASLYAWRRYQEGMRAQRELARLTVHDSLTGLPNRRFLGESFTRVLEDHRGDIGHVAVLFIDLDRFKSVNDTYGHEVGDHLMQAVAQRLRTAVKPEDIVIRYAGDEFVLVISEVPSAVVAERIASRLIKVLETPFEMGPDRVQISASIGIALAENGVTASDELIRDADAAMYQAKMHGSGTYAVFDRSMRERLTPSTAERRLREAIERGELRMAYKPVVALASGRIEGVEAQVRWEDPEQGVVAPDDFLPALEDTGLIVPVGRWMVHQACRHSREWATALGNRTTLSIALRVSPRQLAQSDFVEHLREALAETGASPASIILEVDERSLVGDLGLVRHTLRLAREAGVRIGVDGSALGLGAVSHLHGLDVDVLRIRAAEMDVHDSARGVVVLGHVVGIARALGVTTIATGVDRPEQVDLVRHARCALAQGRAIGATQSARGIAELVLQAPVVSGDEEPRVLAVPFSPRA
jgi:diguanylate cyclase (GGDEF)-like protein